MTILKKIFFKIIICLNILFQVLQECITSEVDILCIITDMRNDFSLEKGTSFFNL